MTTVGIVPHHIRNEAHKLVGELAAELTGRGITVRIPGTDAKLTGLDRWAVPDDGFAHGLDLALSIGGDGTMLRTVDLVLDDDVPVLGINSGHLGYLTVVGPEQARAAVDQALAGTSTIEERMTIAIELSRAAGAPVEHFHALNDAVIEKSSAGHTVRLGVEFNDQPFLDYTTDGLIIASPTGSTAYAFSVRGPIVSPQMRAFVVVPVSPHMLFDRSLVLDGDETVAVNLLDGRDATLFVDGRQCGALGEGSVVLCRQGTHDAKFVTFGARAFHRTLTTKFALPMPEGPQLHRLQGD